MSKLYFHNWLIASAGLLLGPIFWAINTQLGQILPYQDCAAHVRMSAILSLGLAFMTIGCGVVSWRGYRMIGPSAIARSLRFLAAMSCSAALIFAYALILQAVAGLVLTGCEK
jgi:hypothetical protein